MIGHARAVVHIERTQAAAVAIGRFAIQAWLEHVTQRQCPGAVVGNDLLADQIIARLGTVGSGVFHHGAHDVGRGLIQTARFARVGQSGGPAGHTVGHLVAGHIHRYQRRERAAVAIAEGHAETAVLPEGVVVAATIVHPASRTGAVVCNACARMRGAVIVPGQRYAIMRIDRCGDRIAGGAATPGIVGIGDQRAIAGGAVAHVVGRTAAATEIGQFVAGAAAARGVHRHAARIQRTSCASGAGAAATGGMHGIPGFEDALGHRIDDVMHLGRCLVGFDAAVNYLVHQARRALACIQRQTRTRRGILRHIEVRTGHTQCGCRIDPRQQARTHRSVHGLAQFTHHTATRVHDHVATDHRQTLIGAIETHMFGAVGIDDAVACDKGVGRRDWPMPMRCSPITIARATQRHWPTYPQRLRQQKTRARSRLPRPGHGIA